MTISKNKMVTLTYDLRLGGPQGDLVEQATKEDPLKFLFGAGLMLEMFESHLVEKNQGDSFDITLTPLQAYGDRDESAVVDLPKDIFIVDGQFDDEMIAVGNNVPMMTQAGQRMTGLVLEVNEENVKMDFNHPLAGDTLHFTGEIIEVREATDEEIAQSLKGGGCGCDSDGCGDGCGDGCSDDQKQGCGCGGH